MKRLILAAALLAAGAVGLFAQPTTAKPAQAPSVPRPKSPDELKALQAWQAALQANDADAIIKAVDDIVTRFPNTDFKSMVLETEAEAYKQKADWAKAQIYADMALTANPQSFQAALMLADIPAKHTGEHDLDKEESLTKAEGYAHKAIELVTAQAKPPQFSDEQWSDYQKQIVGQAQDDLGLISGNRKNWDSAIAAFKTAIAATAEPAYKVHLANALMQNGKLDDALGVCDQILTEPKLHPQIKAASQDIEVQIAAFLQAQGKNDAAIAILDKVLADSGLPSRVKANATRIRDTATKAKGQ
jgi:tetratricopeptide (TPR) repeat protein